jgi:hypothetical protein
MKIRRRVMAVFEIAGFGEDAARIVFLVGLECGHCFTCRGPAPVPGEYIEDCKACRIALN